MKIVLTNGDKFYRGDCGLGKPEFTQKIAEARIFNDVSKAIQKIEILKSYYYYHFIIKKIQ